MRMQSVHGVEGSLSLINGYGTHEGVLKMKFLPRSEFPAAPDLMLWGKGSFDCAVVRFANNNFAQDDKRARYL